VFVFDFARPVT